VADELDPGWISVLRSRDTNHAQTAALLAEAIELLVAAGVDDPADLVGRATRAVSDAVPQPMWRYVADGEPSAFAAWAEPGTVYETTEDGPLGGRLLAITRDHATAADITAVLNRTPLEGPAEVWVAHYESLSGIVVFADELECRRHAGPATMNVTAVVIGAEV
jgi:hypothetical protein